MSKPIDKNKIVVITGAGVSAASGLKTFRDADGLWNNYSVDEIATPEGWRANPECVLDFYNQLRIEVAKAVPNKAHLSIAALEQKFDVVVVTQNVDDLHERAGSTNVIHVHGKLSQACSAKDKSGVIDIGSNPIEFGDRGDDGAQLRPNIVWFGEQIENHEESVGHIKVASKVLVVGTSLTVYPAAGMVKKARYKAEKLVVQPDLEKKPYGFSWLRGTAEDLVPVVVNRWLDGGKAL